MMEDMKTPGDGETCAAAWAREMYNKHRDSVSVVFTRYYKFTFYYSDGRKLTKTEQVRLIGNSVPPQFSAALARANCPELIARKELIA